MAKGTNARRRAGEKLAKQLAKQKQTVTITVESPASMLIADLRRTLARGIRRIMFDMSSEDAKMFGDWLAEAQPYDFGSILTSDTRQVDVSALSLQADARADEGWLVMLPFGICAFIYRSMVKGEIETAMLHVARSDNKILRTGYFVFANEEWILLGASSVRSSKRVEIAGFQNEVTARHLWDQFFASLALIFWKGDEVELERLPPQERPTSTQKASGKLPADVLIVKVGDLRHIRPPSDDDVHSTGTAKRPHDRRNTYGWRWKGKRSSPERRREWVPIKGAKVHGGAAPIVRIVEIDSTISVEAACCPS